MDRRSRRQQEYKKTSVANNENRRLRTADTRKRERVSRREEEIFQRRGLTVPVEEDVKDPVRAKLQKWKEDKKKKAQEEKKNKKPPFKVGKIYYNDTDLYKNTDKTKEGSGKSKGLGYTSAKFQAPEGVTAMKVPKPVPPTRTLRTRQRAIEKQVETAIHDFGRTLNKNVKKKPTKKMEKAVTKTSTPVLNMILEEPDQHTAAESEEQHQKSVLSSSPPSSQAYLNEPEEPELQSTSSDPVNTMTSQSSRGENLEESSEGSKRKSVCIEPTPLELDTDANSVKTSQDFRKLHNDEVTKLQTLCEDWSKLQGEELPTFINDQIDVAVGYAKLLISQKLRQFSDLIMKHEENDTTLKVLISDLESFWDMVYLQVEDIHKKFQLLEEAKLNNWQEKISKAPKNISKRKSPMKKNVGKVEGKARQNFRAFLANARKNLQKENVSNQEDCGVKTRVAPMSPAVMRVSFLAKQVGSPKVSTPEIPPAKSTQRSRRILHTLNLSSMETGFTPRRSSRLRKASSDVDLLSWSTPSNSDH